VVEGGARRQDSVAAGVGALGEGSPDDVVLVHDGARPLVSPELVARVAAAAAEHGSAIPVVPVAETLKRVVDGQIAATIDRTLLVAAQTPQGIRRDVLARAWAERPPGDVAVWTDEAALLEACRIPVHAVPGESTNLKVTLPDDLARVEAALIARGDVAAGALVPRVGFGDDGHPFGPGAPLALGGLLIDGAPRLHGHSDGDVALHAVCEALLGAAGLGDLGRLFPAGPSTPAGIASTEMLSACLARVAASGYAPVAIDVTLIGARPRLAGYLDAMAAAIAARVGLAASRVNVKASSGNLAGFEGAGRGISARAVAVVAPHGRESSPS
jgi:2-C-methyl-D-erythritol 2,4-cyclodiphosphate synthase